MAMSMSENKAVEKTVKELKKGRKQKGLVSVSGIIVETFQGEEWVALLFNFSIATIHKVDERVIVVMIIL